MKFKRILKKNHCLKGENLEKEISIQFHSDGTPLLVSSKWLRENGGGQIDLCRVEMISEKCKQDLMVRIVEVKSSVGVSYKQSQRLKKSAQLISAVLNLPVIITKISKN